MLMLIATLGMIVVTLLEVLICVVGVLPHRFSLKINAMTSFFSPRR